MSRPRTIDENPLVHLVLGLILVTGTVAAYQLAWHAGYVWNDNVNVTANPLLTAPDGLKLIWFSAESLSQYFPLVLTVFRVEHALWGFDSSGYHWLNILLHAANAVLLWRLLCRLRIPGAWLAAAIFALHPVQVESVAWITQFKNVLMGLFFLSTLLCWARFIEKEGHPRMVFYVAASFFFALALLSNATACTLPAALLLIVWLKRQPITLRLCLQVAPFVLLAGAGAVTAWWAHYHQANESHGLAAVGISDRFLLASRAICFYLSKLVWPSELSFIYPRWPISTLNSAASVWMQAIIAAALAITFLRRYLGRSLEVAMVFFVATLSPMLGFVMLDCFRYSWVADHHQYLACIGPIALFAAVVDLGTARFGRTIHLLVALAGAALLVTLGARTWKQGAIYANEETLWRDTVAKNPGSSLAHKNLGVALTGDVPLEEEEAESRKALEINPNDADAHYTLGHVFERRGMGDEAVAEYDRTVDLDPGFAKARRNLAMLLLQSGRVGEAITHLQELLAHDQGDATLEKTLADILASQGNADGAIAHWKRAAELAPNDAQMQGAAGRSIGQNGRMQEALPYLKRAAELLPQDAAAHYNHATALSIAEHFTEAIPEYQEALRIQPDLSVARGNLASAYALSGQLSEAVAEFERHLSSAPDDARAHRTFAVVLRALGRTEEAAVHEQRASALEAPSSPTPAP